ncbi:MAG: hypothetical protein FWF15_03785 [Oscillospiraceae bacterium]|nr:hypothetical protein [Oscillospiraceae bacterium]
MKNKIILVGGYCAAGKSTFARMLSRELNVPCFERDTIDETICDAFRRENNVVAMDIAMSSSDVAVRVMLHIAERFLQTGKVCILENVFVLEELNEIQILLDKYNCECLFFILQGEPRVMFARYVERDSSGERHWIHKLPEKDWFVNNMPDLYKFDEVEIGQKIFVDTTDFEKVNYNELFEIAKKFIAKD